MDVQNVFLYISINKASVFLYFCYISGEKCSICKEAVVWKHSSGVHLFLRLSISSTGISCNTRLLSFSRKNTCKAFQDPGGKGEIAMESICRMGVDNTEEHSKHWKGVKANVPTSVTPLITRTGLSCALQLPAATKLA